MNMTLTIIERAVVESINESAKSLKTLINDTGIQKKVLQNVILSLIKKNILERNSDVYQLNTKDMKSWSSKISTVDSIKNELRGIFDLVVGTYKKEDSQLRMQKVYMTLDEEKVYNSLIADFDVFVKQVKRNRNHDKLKVETKKQKVVYWGSINYLSLINEALT